MHGLGRFLLYLGWGSPGSNCDHPVGVSRVVMGKNSTVPSYCT